MDRPSYLPPHLTDRQLEAVLHHGSPLLVIAGPGSGKTEVITWRVAHLVRSGRVTPEHLLVTTFTNKAALELKDRIQQKLPEVNAELMQVSTIHSFCADLLRRYKHLTPLPHGFRILDGIGQFLFVYSNRKALGLDQVVKGRPSAFFRSVIGAFNLATEELVQPEELEEWCRKNKACCCDKEIDLWDERGVITEAYRRYQDLLLDAELVDFAFLQSHALALLKGHPPVLRELKDQYRELLVDEYQDTNAAQDQLLALLAGDGRRLTVVGDDDQSIYRFRGATVRNILGFGKRFPDAKKVRLEHNFRSRDPIVDYSLKVIDHNPARYPKSLHSVRNIKTDILLVHEYTAAAEAEAVVDLLQRLHLAGKIRHYGDVAVLLRSVRSYADPYLEALESAGIPYSVLGDASFFERAEISQLYELFNFLGATKAWGDRFLRNDLVGLSESTCRALKAFKDNLLDVATAEGLQSVGVTDENDRARLEQLLATKALVQEQAHQSLLDVFYRLLAATGCVQRFEAGDNVEALANLGLMSQLISSWDEFGSSRNFYPFQRYLKLLKEGGVDPVTMPPEDAVQVMTIHQAKGLEFPVVVLGAAMNGRIPTTRRRDRYEIPYHMRASGPPEVDDPHLVDERKLFYVAITRARDLLIIGTADVVNKRGGGPSPFLYEMFGASLDAITDWTQAYIAEVESRPGTHHEPRPRHSFSSLAYYLQCPLRYKFAVVYGLEPPWLDPFHFGANVHRALELIHRRALSGQVPSEEEAHSIVEETWISSRRTSPGEERAIKNAAVNQLRRYIRESRDQLLKVVQPELSFSVSLEDDILAGKIDLIRWYTDGEVELVDFKTSKAMLAEIEGIHLQLDIYALGAEKSLQYKVGKQTVHFLGDGQVQSWEWSADRERAACSELRSIMERIGRGDFTPRTEYCPHCQEYRQICPYAAV
jgi:DNA helicase-2/ATP-dependent DNA helicase PcrA